MSFGKVHIVKVNDSLIEGTFYWPATARCTENDQNSVMDLFIIWRYINQYDLVQEPESAEVTQNIKLNFDAVVEKWQKIKSNSCLQDKVAHYTVQMLKVLINQIWESGLDVQLVRKYYPTITKAARDIEEMQGMGFKKMIFTKTVIIPVTLSLDGILRKRPTNYIAVSVHVLTRKTATIALLQDFIDIKNQVQMKEESLFLCFLL